MLRRHRLVDLVVRLSALAHSITSLQACRASGEPGSASRQRSACDRAFSCPKLCAHRLRSSTVRPDLPLRCKYARCARCCLEQLTNSPLGGYADGSENGY